MTPQQTSQQKPNARDERSRIEEEEYVRGQYHSLGSGLLGGWSNVGWGGSLDADAPAIAEAYEELHRRAHAGVASAKS